MMRLLLLVLLSAPQIANAQCTDGLKCPPKPWPPGKTCDDKSVALAGTTCMSACEKSLVKTTADWCSTQTATWAAGGQWGYCKPAVTDGVACPVASGKCDNSPLAPVGTACLSGCSASTACIGTTWCSTLTATWAAGQQWGYCTCAATVGVGGVCATPAPATATTAAGSSPSLGGNKGSSSIPDWLLGLLILGLCCLFCLCCVLPAILGGGGLCAYLGMGKKKKRRQKAYAPAPAPVVEAAPQYVTAPPVSMPAPVPTTTSMVAVARPVTVMSAVPKPATTMVQTVAPTSSFTTTAVPSSSFTTGATMMPAAGYGQMQGGYGQMQGGYM